MGFTKAHAVPPPSNVASPVPAAHVGQQPEVDEECHAVNSGGAHDGCVDTAGSRSTHPLSSPDQLGQSSAVCAEAGLHGSCDLTWNHTGPGAIAQPVSPERPIYTPIVSCISKESGDKGDVQCRQSSALPNAGLLEAQTCPSNPLHREPASTSPSTTMPSVSPYTDKLTTPSPSSAGGSGRSGPPPGSSINSSSPIQVPPPATRDSESDCDPRAHDLTHQWRAKHLPCRESRSRKANDAHLATPLTSFIFKARGALRSEEESDTLGIHRDPVGGPQLVTGDSGSSRVACGTSRLAQRGIESVAHGSGTALSETHPIATYRDAHDVRGGLSSTGGRSNIGHVAPLTSLDPLTSAPLQGRQAFCGGATGLVALQKSSMPRMTYGSIEDDHLADLEEDTQTMNMPCTPFSFSASQRAQDVSQKPASSAAISIATTSAPRFPQAITPRGSLLYNPSAIDEVPDDSPLSLATSTTELVDSAVHIGSVSGGRFPAGADAPPMLRDHSPVRATSSNLLSSCALVSAPQQGSRCASVHRSVAPLARSMSRRSPVVSVLPGTPRVGNALLLGGEPSSPSLLTANASPETMEAGSGSSCQQFYGHPQPAVGNANIRRAPLHSAVDRTYVRQAHSPAGIPLKLNKRRRHFGCHVLESSTVAVQCPLSISSQDRAPIASGTARGTLPPARGTAVGAIGQRHDTPPSLDLCGECSFGSGGERGPLSPAAAGAGGPLVASVRTYRSPTFGSPSADLLDIGCATCALRQSESNDDPPNVRLAPRSGSYLDSLPIQIAPNPHFSSGLRAQAPSHPRTSDEKKSCALLSSSGVSGTRSTLSSDARRVFGCGESLSGSSGVPQPQGLEGDGNMADAEGQREALLYLGAPLRCVAAPETDAPCSTDRRKPQLNLSAVLESHSVERHVVGVRQKLLNNKYIIFTDKVLGRGSSSKVKLCLNIEDNSYYAIKILNRKRLMKQGLGVNCALYKVQREIAIMKQLKHENIITLVEVIDDLRSDKIYLILELAIYSELMSMKPDGTVIPDLEGFTTIPEREVVHVVRGIVSALMYAHSHGIAHRDVKPQNILVTESHTVKLSDFGVSIIVDDSSARVCREGSIAFLPPEILVSPEMEVDSSMLNSTRNTLATLATPKLVSSSGSHFLADLESLSLGTGQEPNYWARQGSTAQMSDYSRRCFTQAPAHHPHAPLGGRDLPAVGACVPALNLAPVMRESIRHCHSGISSDVSFSIGPSPRTPMHIVPTTSPCRGNSSARAGMDRRAQRNDQPPFPSMLDSTTTDLAVVDTQSGLLGFISSEKPLPLEGIPGATVEPGQATSRSNSASRCDGSDGSEADITSPAYNDIVGAKVAVFETGNISDGRHGQREYDTAPSPVDPILVEEVEVPSGGCGERKSSEGSRPLLNLEPPHVAIPEAAPKGSVCIGESHDAVDLFKADVFSLGVTAFVLLLGKLPWKAFDAQSQLEAICACPDPFANLAQGNEASHSLQGSDAVGTPPQFSHAAHPKGTSLLSIDEEKDEGDAHGDDLERNGVGTPRDWARCGIRPPCMSGWPRKSKTADWYDNRHELRAADVVEGSGRPQLGCPAGAEDAAADAPQSAAFHITRDVRGVELLINSACSGRESFLELLGQSVERYSGALENQVPDPAGPSLSALKHTEDLQWPARNSSSPRRQGEKAVGDRTSSAPAAILNIPEALSSEHAAVAYGTSTANLLSTVASTCDVNEIDDLSNANEDGYFGAEVGQDDERHSFAIDCANSASTFPNHLSDVGGKGTATVGSGFPAGRRLSRNSSVPAPLVNFELEPCRGRSATHGISATAEHEAISALAVDFIHCCLQFNPSDRWSAFDLYEHPWIVKADTCEQGGERGPQGVDSFTSGEAAREGELPGALVTSVTEPCLSADSMGAKCPHTQLRYAVLRANDELRDLIERTASGPAECAHCDRQAGAAPTLRSCHKDSATSPAGACLLGEIPGNDSGPPGSLRVRVEPPETSPPPSHGRSHSSLRSPNRCSCAPGDIFAAPTRPFLPTTRQIPGADAHPRMLSDSRPFGSTTTPLGCSTPERVPRLTVPQDDTRSLMSSNVTLPPLPADTSDITQSMRDGSLRAGAGEIPDMSEKARVQLALEDAVRLSGAEEPSVIAAPLVPRAQTDRNEAFRVHASQRDGKATPRFGSGALRCMSPRQPGKEVTEAPASVASSRLPSASHTPRGPLLLGWSRRSPSRSGTLLCSHRRVHPVVNDEDLSNAVTRACEHVRTLSKNEERPIPCYLLAKLEKRERVVSRLRRVWQEPSKQPPSPPAFVSPVARHRVSTTLLRQQSHEEVTLTSRRRHEKPQLHPKCERNAATHPVSASKETPHLNRSGRGAPLGKTPRGNEQSLGDMLSLTGAGLSHNSLPADRYAELAPNVPAGTTSGTSPKWLPPAARSQSVGEACPSCGDVDGGGAPRVLSAPRASASELPRSPSSSPLQRGSGPMVHQTETGLPWKKMPLEVMGGGDAGVDVGRVEPAVKDLQRACAGGEIRGITPGDARATPVAPLHLDLCGSHREIVNLSGGSYIPSTRMPQSSSCGAGKKKSSKRRVRHQTRPITALKASPRVCDHGEAGGEPPLGPPLGVINDPPLMSRTHRGCSPPSKLILLPRSPHILARTHPEVANISPPRIIKLTPRSHRAGRSAQITSVASVFPPHHTSCPVTLHNRKAPPDSVQSCDKHGTRR